MLGLKKTYVNQIGSQFPFAKAENDTIPVIYHSNNQILNQSQRNKTKHETCAFVLGSNAIDPSHKSQNALQKYPTIYQFQIGALWDVGLVNYGICSTGLFNVTGNNSWVTQEIPDISQSPSSYGESMLGTDQEFIIISWSIHLNTCS